MDNRSDRPVRSAALRGLRFYSHLHDRVVSRVKDRVHRLYDPEHVFDIEVDDMRFQMAFPGVALEGAVVERIEGRREPETTAMIKSLVRPGDKVLELGGAYGYFTTIMAKSAGPTGRVVSIEGLPSNFKVLSANIARNKLGTVTPYNLFISNTQTGVMSVPISGELPWDEGDAHPFKDAMERLMRTKKNGNGASQHIDVPVKRLTEFLREIDFSPNRIFMDLEGFEVDIFEDLAGGWFKTNRPTIVFEVHPMYYKFGRDQDWIQKVLRENDYEYRMVTGNLFCFPKGSRD